MYTAITEMFMYTAITEMLMYTAITEMLMYTAITEMLMYTAITEMLMYTAITEKILNIGYPSPLASLYLQNGKSYNKPVNTIQKEIFQWNSIEKTAYKSNAI
jgi:hypothetical protein